MKMPVNYILMVIKDKVLRFLASVFHCDVVYLVKKVYYMSLVNFFPTSTCICISKIIIIAVHIQKEKW